MVKYCAAYGCSNLDKGSSTGRSFHRFPRDPKIRDQWIRAVRRKDFTPSLHTVLCSDHFLPEDYLEGKEYRIVRKLRYNAVPSIFNYVVPKEHRRGKKRRISSSLELEDDDHLSANTDILIVPPKMDHNRLISREHAYAFPSDITLAKIKYDNLESLFFKSIANGERKDQGLREAKQKIGTDPPLKLRWPPEKRYIRLVPIHTLTKFK
ncbi:THAP domain-containing protein 2 [Lepeophtheirus salmonis]|uniref:THAP domain-containing protein 2 n=1 Tax=Lepeophtheirus salmonis TaxID=72036 RepID=UPI001AE27F8F|nr:THAP domain-containing protein 2-like [Lepeophtheirus salmonis]